MPRRQREKWIDRTAEASALGLNRRQAIAHNGWQFAIEPGAGNYAANGVTTTPAASTPADTMRLYSTSAAILALYSVGGTVKFYLSPDGIDPYVQKYSGDGGRMAGALTQLFIDCGSGRFLIVEYSTDVGVYPYVGNTSKIWVSTDSGENWTVLLTTAAGAIRHFHGGLWDADYSKLYLFTGDVGRQDSILVCTDLADLLANPLTWRTRWGLDDTTRSTIDSSYVVGYGTYDYRITGAVIHNNHIITGTDLYQVVGGVPMAKWHRSTLRWSNIQVEPHSFAATDGNGVGEIWGFSVADNGIPVAYTNPKAAGSPDYGDGYSHVYALNPDGRTAHEILRLTPGSGINGLPHSIHSVGGFTIISPNDGDLMPGYLSHAYTSGNIRMRPSSSMSPVTLTPRTDRRAGVSHPEHLLKEDGAALLLEADTGTNTALILGE